MSVNGRPFRPDPTSYQMTGIPCGNPRRYKSRAVIRMTRDDKIPYEDQQIGIPGTGTETEAEKELKKLVDQQMNISSNAGEKKVSFVTSTREIMGTAAGFMTLDQFQKVSESDKKSNEFRSLGFSDAQIGVMLQPDGKPALPTRKRKQLDEVIGPKPMSASQDEEEADSAPNCFMPHPDFVSQSLSELRELQGKRDAEFEAAALKAGPQMSRHRLQLEAALLQGKEHLPLAHIYVNGARKFSEQSNPGASVNDIMLPESVSSPSSSRSESPSDSAGQVVPKTSAEHQAKVQKTDEKVVLTGKVATITDQEFDEGRILAEEIKKQFPKYETGIPSQVLYVKNLANGVTAHDLVSLFIRFQEEGKDKIKFKLMDGKMKGQAFITFHDEPTATRALKLAHGYVFKSKAMLIQYGKQK